MNFNLEDGVYFVSGIDTDTGKSYVTGEIARLIAMQGRSVTTQKFIQTGGLDSQGMSIDIVVHRKIMGIDFTEEDINGITAPSVFSYPASPELASRLDGKDIDFDSISRSTDILRSKYDILLIEGAGGLHVPLKEFYTTIDYIKESGFPLIFVTSGKLGSINHTLLSLEACKNRGINIAMIVYNNFNDQDEIINADTLMYLKKYSETFFPQTQFVEVDKIDI